MYSFILINSQRTMYACIVGLAYVVFEVRKVDEDLDLGKLWILAFIHFLWHEGNCWNDLRDWCHQEHSLLQTMRLEKIKGSFSAGLRQRVLMGKQKPRERLLSSPSTFSIIFCIVFFILKTIAKLFGNGAKRLTMLWCLRRAAPQPEPTASHAGCDFFFDRLPNRDRDSQRQAKAPFHTQLDRAKKGLPASS